MSRDELGGADAEQRGGLVEIRSVIPDADLDIRVSGRHTMKHRLGRRGGERGGEVLRDPGPHDRGSDLAGCEPHQHSARGGDEIHHAHRLRVREALAKRDDHPQGLGGAEFFGDLGEQSRVAEGSDPGVCHHGARTDTDAASNAARTARAAATAPGESPWRQREPAATATLDPSTATTVRSRARRTARAAAASGSSMTAPGSPRGTSSPLGV